jgi:hypothetical protein
MVLFKVRVKLVSLKNKIKKIKLKINKFKKSNAVRPSKGPVTLIVIVGEITSSRR